MAKFLIRGTYTPSGVAGILKEGGSKRKEAVAQAAKNLGGTLEAFYFAFGDNDYYVIVDLPDNKAAIAGSLVSNVTGTVNTKHTVLITPEEVDEATKLNVGYRAPGQ